MAEILTTKGMMDISLLEVRPVTIALASGGSAAFTEYWYNGELVKRDIAVKIDPSKVIP